MFLRIVGLWIERTQPRDTSPESAAAVQDCSAAGSAKCPSDHGDRRPATDRTGFKTPVGPVLSGISRL
jgi:hypothetical protein